ncbi:hypothetical protein HG535_0E01690 [Zygotorulaspora mrakii]|uniref:Tricalbin n=1 Tax=Zygotorulaspora mrakii TaxID=42260 RepID=A0A7H9B341_ZYGMR|nr:uncharacterized protein HG535_0E01690 [Zygotorulaspora mrakii]QLG73085.1 hypothetical protein HG535_0E01690 [Zygotorulaspora mrakii]
MIEVSPGQGREDQAYMPKKGNVHAKDDKKGLANKVMDEYGEDLLDNQSSSKISKKLESLKDDEDNKKNDKQNEKSQSADDVFVASKASKTEKLPAPNMKGSVGSFPLERIHPDDFKRAPPRDPNKYDTSMTTPGKMDTLKESQIEDAIKSENPEVLFPWKAIAGFDSSGTSSSGGSNARVIKAYILETFYNDWYSNVALISGTCFGAWLCGYIGMSWWLLGYIFLCAGAVFGSEYRRFGSSIRDDLKRTAIEETLSDRSETTLWMNSFLSKFWVIYMPVLSQQVLDIVNPSLVGVAPGYGIDAISLEEFTLGSKAPAIKEIKSNTKAAKDVAEMIWSFAFTPNDVSDMTQREAKQMINPKVVMGVTLGKGIISKTLPIITEDINVSGKMRVVLKFGQTFPNIKVVSVQLLEPPLIEFALKPVGGDALGLDVMSFLPGLKSFVKTMINSNVGPMLYAPHHLDVDVEELIASQANDAVGVLALTVSSAKELQSSDSITDTLDPYIYFKTEKPSPGAQSDMLTSIKSNIKDPVWNETKYILLNDLNQRITLSCFDFNDARKDTLIGNAEVNLKQLTQDPVMTDLTTELKHGTHTKGRLNYSMHWFPVIQKTPDESSDAIKYQNKGTGVTAPNDNSSVSSSDESDQEDVAADEEDEDEEYSDAGIVKLTLQNIKNLVETDMPSGTLSPCATLFADGKEVKKFRTLKRINEPSWAETVELFIPSRADSRITLEVYNDRSTSKPLLSKYSASLDEVLTSFSLEQQSVKGSPKGDIYMNAEWKPVNMTGIFSAANTIQDAIGFLRLHIKDLKVIGDLSGVGDIDPYFTIVYNGHIDYKSSHFSAESNPMFNKVLYFPITSSKQKIVVSTYDYQSIGKDRVIGSAEIPLSKVLEMNPETGRHVSVDKSKENIKLQLVDNKKRVSESYVNVSLSFTTTIPVYSPEEYELVQEKEKELKKKREEFEEVQVERKNEMDKRPNDFELVEVEDPFEEEEKSLTKKERLSIEELIGHNSGILSLELFSANFARKNCFLLMYIDEIPYPKFTSSRSRNGKLPDTSTSFFVRDLKNSKIIFRLSEKRIPRENSHIISEASFETLNLLQNSYGNSSKVSFGGSSIELSCLYVPSSQSIPESDTVLDTGYLDLNVISASNLLSMDRNGYSDPFFYIFIDGVEIHKSKIVKKTLSPVWNEKIKIPVPSRSRNDVEIRLYDWDRAGDNDSLGFVSLDLSKIKPKKKESWELPLDTQGTIKMEGVFTACYMKPPLNANQIKKMNFASATFNTISGAGLGTVTGVSNVGLGLATGGIGAATGGLERATSGLDRGFDKGAKFLKSPFGHDSSKKKKKQSQASHPIPLPEYETRGSSDANHRKSLGFAEAKASLDIDRTVPNNEYATVQNLDPKTKLPAGDSNSSPQDARSASITSKENTHTRNVSQASSFARTLAPNGTYRGTATIIGAENLGKAIQIKVSLAQGGRLKSIYRTRTVKADEKVIAKFDETCSFKASPEANLVFAAISHHKFTKDKEIGIAQITLNDPQIQRGEQIAMRLADGRILFKLDYGADEDVPPVPTIPEQYT